METHCVLADRQARMAKQTKLEISKIDPSDEAVVEYVSVVINIHAELIERLGAKTPTP